MNTHRGGVRRLLERVRAEYDEIPGLDLTKRQMARLFGCDPATCDALVDALLDARVLRETTRGTYVKNGFDV
jgi:hypothetical protein